VGVMEPAREQRVKAVNQHREDSVMRKLLPIVALLTLGLASCHQEGPAERAGRSLDNAGQRVGDALNPPKGPAQSTGRQIDRTLGN
jgi:hypothetical protein